MTRRMGEEAKRTTQGGAQAATETPEAGGKATCRCGSGGGGMRCVWVVQATSKQGEQERVEKQSSSLSSLLRKSGLHCAIFFGHAGPPTQGHPPRYNGIQVRL